MKHLYCDFEQPRRPGPTSWLLFAGGVATALAVLALDARIESENATHERTLRQAEQQPAVVRTTRSADDAKTTVALDAVRRTAQQIALPWNELFVALEQASHRDVALLSLAPDGNRGEVRIAAEARSMAAMLAYHRRLEASGQLHDITLTDHEVVANDPMHPVRFNIIGTWVKANATP